MQYGMIGLGRMGANMVRRLGNGHQCVAYDTHEAARAAIAGPGVTAVSTLEQLVARLEPPRVLWMMVPAGAVEAVLEALTPLLAAGDIVIDGGNSYYRDDIRRAAQLRARQLHHVDVGTSGGVAGLERGYCLMIGGEPDVVERITPLLATLAPGSAAAPPTPGRRASDHGGSSADQGYLHCGAHGAGHFVKMVHNGIEYGIMGAYAEGMSILRHADAGKHSAAADAETTPMVNSEFYQYDLNLPDIAELWRRGSVIGSWLLDLTAGALLRDPALEAYAGRVSDSGEGRWTLAAAIDEAVPAPILSAALFARFSSRGNADYADKLLSAMRQGFGGHLEQATVPKEGAS
jgi:6-phosphogluconate dehydrogenase